MSKTIPDPDQIARSREKLIEERRKRMMFPKSFQSPDPDTEENPEPVAAESSHPPAMESLPKEADQKARADATQGASIPIGSVRPKPTPAAKEEGSVIVAKELAGQLATAPEVKANMRIDERKLAVLKEAEVIALSHFSYRFVYDGVRYWGHLVDWQLTGSQGVGGLGRRHILQALANTSGIQTVDKAEKPNVIARNLFNRSWKEKATREGKVPEE